MNNPFEDSEDELWANTNDEDKEVQLDAYNSLTNFYWDKSKYSQGISAANAGIELARQLGNKPMEGELNHMLGLCCGASNRFDEALKAFSEAIEIHRIYSDERFLAKSLHFRALSYRDLGLIDDAIEGWKSSSALYESAGLYWQAADSALLLADTLRNNNLHEQALHYFTKSLELANQESHFPMTARAYLGQGHTLLEMNRIKDSVLAFKKCLDMHDFLEQDYPKRIPQYFYAKALAADGNPDVALIQLDNAIAAFKESNRNEDAARAESFKCQVLMQLHRADEAILLHDRLRTVFASMKHKDEMLYHDIDFAPFLAKVPEHVDYAIALLDNALEKSLALNEREAFRTAGLNLAEIRLANGIAHDESYDFVNETPDQEWGEYYLERLRHKAIRAQVLYAEGHTSEAAEALLDARDFAHGLDIEYGHAFDILGDWAKDVKEDEQIFNACGPLEDNKAWQSEPK